MKQGDEVLTENNKFPYRASPEQLTLTLESAPAFTEQTLHELISGLTGRAIKLTLTNNSTSLLSVRERGAFIAVRLHRMFLKAAHSVIKELAGYIKTRAGETPLFWEFVNSNQMCIKPSNRKHSVIHKGNRYDLLEIFELINNEYFDGRISCAITWGTRRAGRAKRRTLGSFSGASELIRINPLLDSLAVPKYYIEYVVYHEMLHADMHAKASGSKPARRRRVHCSEFKQREREFRQFERAIKWEG
jgi:hypothetical protein